MGIRFGQHCVGIPDELDGDDSDDGAVLGDGLPLGAALGVGLVDGADGLRLTGMLRPADAEALPLARPLGLLAETLPTDPGLIETLLADEEASDTDGADADGAALAETDAALTLLRDRAEEVAGDADKPLTLRLLTDAALAGGLDSADVPEEALTDVALLDTEGDASAELLPTLLALAAETDDFDGALAETDASAELLVRGARTEERLNGPADNDALGKPLGPGLADGTADDGKDDAGWQQASDTTRRGRPP